MVPTSTGAFLYGSFWILKILMSRVTPGPVVLVELLRPQYRQSPAMPRPVEPQPVGKPSRSPPLHLPVAGSFFESAVGSQCTHSKLRNRPSFFAATKAPLCASSGEDFGSSSPCAFMRPPGNFANGMSNTVYVPGTQSTALPDLGSVHCVALPFPPALCAGSITGIAASPNRTAGTIHFERMKSPSSASSGP